MAGGRGEKKDCDRTAAGYRQQGWLKTSGSCCCDGAVRGRGGTRPGSKSGRKELGATEKLLWGCFPQQLKHRASLPRLGKETGPAALRDMISERWPREHVKCHSGQAHGDARLLYPIAVALTPLLQKGNGRLVTALLRTGDYGA